MDFKETEKQNKMLRKFKNDLKMVQNNQRIVKICFKII